MRYVRQDVTRYCGSYSKMTCHSNALVTITDYDDVTQTSSPHFRPLAWCAEYRCAIALKILRDVDITPSVHWGLVDELSSIPDPFKSWVW